MYFPSLLPPPDTTRPFVILFEQQMGFPGEASGGDITEEWNSYYGNK